MEHILLLWSTIHSYGACPPTMAYGMSSLGVSRGTLEVTAAAGIEGGGE